MQKIIHSDPLLGLGRMQMSVWIKKKKKKKRKKERNREKTRERKGRRRPFVTYSEGRKHKFCV